MHVKLTDFGTARLLDENEDASQVRANSFVGTAEYVSPELLKDKAASFGSDWWALGCILYQLLAGRPPFKGANEYQTFQKIIALDYSFPVGFPDTAKDLVEKFLVLDPDQRISSGPQGVSNLQQHPFFDGVEFGADLWKQTPPRLLPFLPAIHTQGRDLRSDLDAINGEEGEDESKVGADSFTSFGGQSGFSEQQMERQMTPSTPTGYRVGEMPVINEEQWTKLREQQRNPKWAQVLDPAELVIKYGVVSKRRGFFSKRRLLVLTDRPRLFYVSADESAKWEVKGEIHWSPRLHIERKDATHFFIHTPRKVHYFEAPESETAEWIAAISKLLTDAYGVTL
jgi:3-phosphoinositide dependent protein kinase-1